MIAGRSGLATAQLQMFQSQSQFYWLATTQLHNSFKVKVYWLARALR
jgi:hypothetical protein